MMLMDACRFVNGACITLQRISDMSCNHHDMPRKGNARSHLQCHGVVDGFLISIRLML